MRRGFILSCIAALTMLLAACGGGGGNPGTNPRAPQDAPLVLDTNTLLDWAEGRYPALFPVHEGNRTLGPYTYRYYAASNTYVGTGGDNVYLLGPMTGGQLIQVGTMSGFRCIVLPAACAATLAGTAATGAPIANATVTIRDAVGNQVSTTTNASGAFSAGISGLTRPLLLQVATAGGARLYSVTADSNTATVANITPYTDLIVRSWYGVQSLVPDTAFAAPATYPPPTPAQVESIGREVLTVAQLAIATFGSPIAQPADFITRAFATDGSGTDRLLDNTRITAASTGALLAVTLPGASQSTSVTYDAAARAVTLNTTTTADGAVTTAIRTTVLAVTATQTTAVDEINARLAAFANVINTRGSALTGTDLLPFFAADALEDGMTATQSAGDLAAGVRGRQITASIGQVRSLDATGGSAEVLLRLSQTVAGQTMYEDEVANFRRVGGVWLMSGNGRIAEVDVQAEARTEQGTFTQSGPLVNVDVRPPEGSVSNVAVTGLANLAVQRGPVEVTDTGVRLSTFYANTGPISGTLPAAGTPVTVTLTRASGGNVSYTIPLNAFTTETIRITSPAVTGLAAANLGGTLGVSWTLPRTYAAQRVSLSAFVFTSTDPAGGSQCEVDANGVLTSASTSGTINMPTTCDGQPVRRVNINVSTRGPNGERSAVIYTF